MRFIAVLAEVVEELQDELQIPGCPGIALKLLKNGKRPFRRETAEGEVEQRAVIQLRSIECDHGGTRVFHL
jgi:hypothetical protein